MQESVHRWSPALKTQKHRSAFPMKYHPINDKEFFMNRDYIGKHWNRKFIRAVQAVLNSTKGKIGRGVDFFEEAFGRDIDEFMKILWMPETFIIYRRIYDADLRNRLADRYTTVTKHDCDLTNEWWGKFKALPPDKLERAKAIIALNKFKDGDFLVFGPETRGLPQEYVTKDTAVTLPMKEGQRSLNLSNSVAITVYEVIRQIGM